MPVDPVAFPSASNPPTVKPADDDLAPASGSQNPSQASDAAAPGAATELLGRVVQGAHDTVDRLAAQAAPHVQRLQDGVAQTGDTLKARADQASAMGDEWADSLRTTVREHPLAAVATALAVGLVLARLTS